MDSSLLACNKLQVGLGGHNGKGVCQQGLELCEVLQAHQQILLYLSSTLTPAKKGHSNVLFEAPFLSRSPFWAQNERFWEKCVCEHEQIKWVAAKGNEAADHA